MVLWVWDFVGGGGGFGVLGILGGWLVFICSWLLVARFPQISSFGLL